MLPIGSIVYLKEGRVKIMVENRYPSYFCTNKHEKELLFSRI